MVWTTEESGFDLQQGQEMFLGTPIALYIEQLGLFPRG
jgi:hypothetical protein